VEVDAVFGLIGQLAVVVWRIQTDDVTEMVQDVYEGQEQIALKAIHIQIGGNSVRC